MGYSNGFIPKVYVLSEFEDLKSQYLDKSIWLNNPKLFLNLYPNPVPITKKLFQKYEEVIIKQIIPYDGDGRPQFYYFKLESLDGERVCFMKVPLPNEQLNSFYSKPTDENTFLCNDVTRKVDKFDDQVSIISPLMKPIVYSKYLDGDIERTFLRIRVNGSTVNYGCKGVTLILKSGERLKWTDEPIETGYNEFNYNWTYTSFTLLNEEIIEKLKDDPITDVKLYIYTSSIDYPEIYSTYLNCILDMN